MSGAHSCPSCPAVTDRDDVCINCDAETTEGFCATCDPAPLLASLADSRVSPEVVRVAVTAAVEGEREEIALMLEGLADDPKAEDDAEGAALLRSIAAKVRARGLVRID